MPPAIVMRQAKIDLHEGTPFWSLRFANQVQTNFIGRAICFACIATNAGADNIFPRRGSAAIARNHVIQVEVFAFKYFAAILAGIIVALKNIMPGEFYLFFREPIKHQQQNHARHANSKRNGVDAFRVRFNLGKVVPLIEIKGLKSALIVAQNDVGMVFK